VTNGEGRVPECEAAPPPAMFFVSVAFKGFSDSVSLLFATLAGSSASVESKGVIGVLSL